MFGNSFFSWLGSLSRRIFFVKSWVELVTSLFTKENEKIYTRLIQLIDTPSICLSLGEWKSKLPSEIFTGKFDLIEELIVQIRHSFETKWNKIYLIETLSSRDVFLKHEKRKSFVKDLQRARFEFCLSNVGQFVNDFKIDGSRRSLSAAVHLSLGFRSRGRATRSFDFLPPRFSLFSYRIGQLPHVSRLPNAPNIFLRSAGSVVCRPHHPNGTRESPTLVE